RLFVKFSDKYGRKTGLIVVPADPVEQIHKVRPIDAGLGGVDDDEHLGGKVSCLAIKDDAWNFDLVEQTRISSAVKAKSGEPMLAVNNQKTGFRIFQVANRFIMTERPKFQHILGE